MTAGAVPSIKTITAAFPEIGPEEVKVIRQALEDATDNDRNVFRALRTVDVIIDGHGVESFGDTEGCYVQYVNMGDAYKTTVLFDERNGLTKVTTWGDYVESWEKRGRRFK